MHAERRIATASGLSFCLSVRLSICPWRWGSLSWSHRLEISKNNFTVFFGVWRIYLLMNWIDKRVDDFIKYYYRNGAHLGLTSSIKHYSPVASSLAFGRLPQQPQLQQHRFVAAAAANILLQRAVSHSSSLCADANITDLLQREYPKILTQVTPSVELSVTDIR